MKIKLLSPFSPSGFSSSSAEFVSVARVAALAVSEGLISEQLASERVHIAYGMSKDFGMNGFRVGCLHTKNKNLLEVRISLF